MENTAKKQITNCADCGFLSACFASKLEPEAAKLWNAMKAARHLKDGEEIYGAAQKPAGFFVVCKGRAKVFSTDARGQQMINWIRHPGELFGHIAFFSGNPYSCNARAMGDTILSFFSEKAMDNFLASNPKTYRLFLRKLAEETHGLQKKLNDTAYQPAKGKVAKTLLKAVSFKSKDTAAPAIYGLKRTEIAEITGLALETVVRILAEFEKKNWIKRETKSIKILDHAALSKIANPHFNTGK
ncbi:MAG: Crp/Fnr family transcriptional regulator [Elusimicrobia bacterium]|nr:Crp/Fnr family transcriptional regulator [Elusimicrobiota bacterium]